MSCNNKDVEEHLNDCVTAMVPDVLDNILSRCETRKGNVIIMSEAKQTNNSHKKRWLKPTCATAAAAAIILGCTLGFGQYQKAYAAEYFVSLDANPGVELKVGHEDKVKAVYCHGEDAEDFFEEFEELENMDVKEAVKLLFESMVEKGFISDSSNALLISVESKKDDGQRLQNELTEAVSVSFAENGIEGAILSQRLAADKGRKSLAKKYEITDGKAALISSLIENSSEYGVDEFDELAELPVNDICMLAEKCLGGMSNVTITGTPSSKKYVSVECAITNTCAQANVTVDDDVTVSAKIGLGEGGKLIYDVLVKAENVSVECNVDALTGAILKTIKNSPDAGSASDESVSVNVKDASPGGETSVGVNGVPFVTKSNVSVKDTSRFGGTTVDVTNDPATGSTTVKVRDKSPFDKTEVDVVVPPVNPSTQSPSQIIDSIIRANLHSVS